MVKTALGLHPQIAHLRKAVLSLFDEYLYQTNYVGEVGLDGSPPFRSYWREQISVLEHILHSCSKAFGKILSLHCRCATSALLQMISKYKDVGIPVIHWFSVTKTELKRAVDMGCWFSVGPAMLKNSSFDETIHIIPRNRLLTETDGPFVVIGNARIDSSSITLVIKRIAKSWRMSLEEAEQIVQDNFTRLEDMFPANAGHA